MTTLLQKIRSRGYWQMIVRPTTFDSERVHDIALLHPILERIHISLRGWDFPHLDTRNKPLIDIDWIGQEFDWEHHKSIWRFYQSGQFIHVSGMAIDWRDESTLWSAHEDWKPGQFLGIQSTLYRFTEFFEFAARLALSEAGDEQMHIAIMAGNLKGRALFPDSNTFNFQYLCTANILKYPQQITLSQTELVAASKEHALNTANELFKRFGWHTTIKLLRDLQKE